jgi:hypothetical protein
MEGVNRVIHMSELKNFDSSEMNYRSWIRFFFDRPVVKNTDDLYVMYMAGYETFHVEHPEKLLEHLTRLCNEFPLLVTQYSLPQIDQGIWEIFGDDFECHQCLFLKSIPLEKRIACIRSMLIVYKDFVAASDLEVMENCFDMWWDFLGNAFWRYASETFSETVRSQSDTDPDSTVEFERDLRVLERLVEEDGVVRPSADWGYQDLSKDMQAVLDSMFETLKDILELADLRCEQYALHGLGHLHHPGVKELVQKYIDKHKGEMDPEDLTWLEQCRDGTVM